MLQVNAKTLPRLAEIEKDLILRRKRAEEEQWLGEIEGIDMTLTFVRTKQADAARLAHRSPVDLGRAGDTTGPAQPVRVPSALAKWRQGVPRDRLGVPFGELEGLHSAESCV
ncbi:hypothetical protein [Streptomyces cyaneofuscatus]|uniref:hypothetical protein n=1 Tax=Streptomyces cyaneofuscatus TaxID=66883 RepID=UPI00382BC54B